MSKLCSLKEIVPGSVVELPLGYRGDQRLGVVLGLEYTADKKHISSLLAKRGPNQQFVTNAIPALPDETQFVVEEDSKLQSDVMDAFVGHKLALPQLGMSTGCDPEIFVVHADGSVFPAWEFMPDKAAAQLEAKKWLLARWSNGDGDRAGSYWAVPDDAHTPKKVPAYWDGAQAEFAPWAKNCLETLHHGTQLGLQSVLDFARAKDPTAKLTLSNVVQLPEDVLKNTDDKFIQFRCSESYNIYNDPGDGVPNARQYKFRCAGGHAHIGFSRTFTAPAIEQIVRGLDGILGVIGVSLAAGIDNPERRRTYGRAGEFRLPQHGLEYRVLSNFWLCHPAIAMLVFELARVIVRLSESGLYNICWLAEEQEIRDIINGCDVNGARKILARNMPTLAGLMHELWTSEVPAKKRFAPEMRSLALRTILNGVDTAITDPFDIEKNWKLNSEDWLSHCRGKGDSWLSLVSNKLYPNA